MTQQRPASLTLKIATLVALLTWTAVCVAAIWGILDWRWIPTTLIAAIVLLITGGFIELQLDQRAERREEARRLAEWADSPAGQFGQQLAAGLDGLLKSARGEDLNR